MSRNKYGFLFSGSIDCPASPFLPGTGDVSFSRLRQGTLEDQVVPDDPAGEEVFLDDTLEHGQDARATRRLIPA
jgi:hypothetical protein